MSADSRVVSNRPLDIRALDALEILDSRGRPTLRVTMTLADRTRYHAGVPSGASVGDGEPLELRDHDPARYGGLGVRQAVANVEGELAAAVVGERVDSQATLDRLLVACDGTAGMSRLGANAIVGISMAAARAFAGQAGMPLWQWLCPKGVVPTVPMPFFNVLNGGLHADNGLDFQEFMIAPLGARSIGDAVRAGAQVYGALRANLQRSGSGIGLGDEGGFAPAFTEPEEALRALVAAIDAAGYPTGSQGVAIALDPAANSFFRDGTYVIDRQELSASDLIARYEQMIAEFPICSIEDGLAEWDRAGWREITDRLGDRVQLVGDDIFVTNAARIAQAAEEGIANAALIKVNQSGTVTGTFEAMSYCREHSYGAMVSHRSGETNDDFIADLAVSSGCGQLKSGAPARGERVAKYNRLLEIADAYPDLPFAAPTPATRNR